MTIIITMSSDAASVHTSVGMYLSTVYAYIPGRENVFWKIGKFVLFFS